MRLRMNEEMCVEKMPITDEYLEKMDAYWRAANYLAAAQLYLLDNPLLREDYLKDKAGQLLSNWQLSNMRPSFQDIHL